MTRPLGPAITSPREGWADVAKGACIVLVVLWHVLTKSYLLVDWRLAVPVPGLWGTLGELFLPLRMPLFFTISGVFAAAAATQPWSAVAAGRVWVPYRVYLLWLMIHTLVFTLAPDFPSLHAATVPELAAQATVNPTNLWYLWALAFYFVVGKLTWRLPTHLVLVVAFAVSTAVVLGLCLGAHRALRAVRMGLLFGSPARPVVQPARTEALPAGTPHRPRPRPRRRPS